MIDSDDKKRKRALLEKEEEWDSISRDTGGDTGEGSSGGRGGAIEFRDFIFIRSDEYTAEEERQLLSVHKDASGALIEKQKKLREQRKDKKENPNRNYQQGLGLEARGEGFLRHPILSEKAEFDGADPQVNLDPTINEAETNNEKREELTYQLQLRLGLQNQPRFIPPKPSPF